MSRVGKIFLLNKSEPTPVTPSSEDDSSQFSALKQAATSDTVTENHANLEDTSKRKSDFKCESCNYTNKSEKRLKTHMARNIMEHQCDKCNHRTTTKASLQKHMTQVYPPSLGGYKS